MSEVVTNQIYRTKRYDIKLQEDGKCTRANGYITKYADCSDTSFKIEWNMTTFEGNRRELQDLKKIIEEILKLEQTKMTVIRSDI